MSYNNYGNNFQRFTPAVLNLIIINVIVFLGEGMFGFERVFDLFALHYYRSDYFRVYQIVTHMFLHGSFFHLLFNMYALWMFGTIVERVWGPKRFLVFYFACGIGAALVQMGSYAWDYRQVEHVLQSLDRINYYQNEWRLIATVGASGAIMGVIAAFGYLFPNTEMIVIPVPVPVKAKWVVLGFIAIDVFSGIAGDPGDHVAHFAHVGGAVTGFLIVYFQNKTRRKTFY